MASLNILLTNLTFTECMSIYHIYIMVPGVVCVCVCGGGGGGGRPTINVDMVLCFPNILSFNTDFQKINTELPGLLI